MYNDILNKLNIVELPCGGYEDIALKPLKHKWRGPGGAGRVDPAQPYLYKIYEMCNNMFNKSKIVEISAVDTNI